MKYIRALVYGILFIYIFLALVKPKKIYVDRFTQDMSFLEWSLLQPFPTMYSSENTLKTIDSVSTSISWPYHHPLKYIINEKNTNQGIHSNYELVVKYRQYESKKKYTRCQDTLYVTADHKEKHGTCVW